MRGFTLIELLLSVAIIGILTTLSLPVYLSFQNRDDLDNTTQSVASMLLRAQTYARAVEGDNQWGVEVQSSAVTLFQGTNFASRNTAFDEVITVPGSTTVSGLGEVLFNKVSGLPNTTGSITLTANTNDTRTIRINAKGMVDY